MKDFWDNSDLIQKEAGFSFKEIMILTLPRLKSRDSWLNDRTIIQSPQAYKFGRVPPYKVLWMYRNVTQIIKHINYKTTKK